MAGFEHTRVILILLLTALSVVGRWLPWPQPITHMLGASAVALWPAFPRIALDPGFFFLCFVPPLLFADGWLMPLRDFLAARRPILLLAIGLVVFTTVVVGLVAHALVHPGSALSGPWRLRSRRGDLAHRCRGRGRHPASAQGPGAAHGGAQRRKPDERRHRAGGVQIRPGRDGGRRVFTPRGDARFHARGRGRVRRRSGDRLSGGPGARPAPRDAQPRTR